MQNLKNHLKTISKFESAVSLLSWDFETYMPPKAAQKRAEIIGEIAGHAFKLFTSDKTGLLIEKAESEASSDIDKAVIRVAKKEYEKAKKIPPELFKEFQITTSKAQHFWEIAKNENNFAIFQPHLEKIVELTGKIVDCLGYKENKYDTLLDQYEPGLKTSQLKKIISYVKPFLVNFLDKIENGTKPDDKILTGDFSIEKQKKFSEKILDFLNYDKNAGRLDVSAHPFTITIGAFDVRITTRYSRSDLKNSIFSTIHECGHALYEQGIPEDFRELPIGEGASMAIHESQSRFWENIVGRSLNFWKFVYPTFCEIFSEFENVPVEKFWKAINKVERSFIRTEADEVTYNLHIMLRFEIEEALINNKISVKDLPVIWNEKMKEYIGVIPEKESDGVLQDVHWSHGSFGYFPSYMLGNLYAAQFYHTMTKDISDFDERILQGDFKSILNWLREKIHSKGKIYEPLELLKNVTGEDLNPEYYANYITKKFTMIYNL
ncbi:carboxypeptidase M32 [Thermosipho ferrireducens]|uniref:Metal-dependent carboxypeptidase n=1 Tax=Thermosipho ferrireducens TaxID=2571116 RepID=A0ABX7SA44_9BACT|nr:carboxypeptidase M32 [Thermosipho ferrireducens]